MLNKNQPFYEEEAYVVTEVNVPLLRRVILVTRSPTIHRSSERFLSPVRPLWTASTLRPKRKMSRFRHVMMTLRRPSPIASATEEGSLLSPAAVPHVREMFQSVYATTSSWISNFYFFQSNIFFLNFFILSFLLFLS